MPPAAPDARELPTLGWYVLDWMAEYLVIPDGPGAGQPLILTVEQAQFVLNFYAVDPVTGKRRVRRGMLSRPKGWGKSPLLAGLSIVEALADVVPDGWDANGDPVGRPWSSLGFKPKVQIAAVSEDQTANTWDPVLEMCTHGAVLDAYGIVPMETFVAVPRGRIEYVTSSATSREGGRPVFAVLDQTESWHLSNGGHRLAGAIRRNLTKTGGSSVESPNAFRPGFKSVAELTHEAWRHQEAGRSRGRAGGILLDHREAPADTVISDRESLIRGLAYAYGCSADHDCVLPGHSHPRGWIDLDRVVEDFWDPSADPSDSRMFFLNQITSASDSWVTRQEWDAARHVDADGEPFDPVLEPGEAVTLGFDGSRRREQGRADATALVACRVSDGYTWAVAVWQQPEGVDDWQVPAEEVDRVVRATVAELNVVGFYADPAKWESWVAGWERSFGHRLQVKASEKHPIEWWMTGGRSNLIVKATEKAHTAIVSGEMSHGGELDAVLGEHVINARRREGRSGVQIGKETPNSPRKIDAAVAFILAYQARLDAVAAGIRTRRRKASRVPRRIY